MKKHINHNRKLRRKLRVSANINGTVEKPRIAVYRSNKYTYAQAIDDVNRKTICSASSLVLSKEKSSVKGKKTEVAKQIGIKLAKILIEKKIEKGVFDRSMYAYNGRVKAVAEGLREGGLKI